MVILVAPGLSPADLTSADLPTLQALAARGACGWMNVQTARTPGLRQRVSPSAACLTLGAGARASAPAGTGTVQDARRANAGTDHPVPVGALGDALRAARISAGVIGNADADAPDRSARLICTDSAGRVGVDLSAADACLERDPSAPYGVRADLTAYGRAPSCDFQVWVFGDIERAARYAPLCVPAVARAHRRNALRRLDILLATMLPRCEPGASCVLMAPTPAADAPAVDRLAPILWIGEDCRPGVLTSGSTRTPGLVLATDFLPWVVERFGGTVPRGAVGRPFVVLPREGVSARTWRAMYTTWLARALAQNALGGAPAPLAVLVACAAWALAWRGFDRRYVAAARGAALLVLSLPLLQMLLPLVLPASVMVGAVALGLACAIAFGVGAGMSDRAGSRIAFGVCAVTAVTVAVDLATGCRLQRTAWLSYSVMSGARFYGIGNEYAGVFCAVSIAALGWAFGSAPRGAWAAYWILAVACVLVGAPFAGANAGGLLGMGMGVGVAGLVWWRGMLRARDVALAALVGAGAMAAVTGLDLLRAGSQQSHIARALAAGAAPASIAVRKAMLNGFLLLHSAWSLTLVAGCVGGWMLWRRLRATGRLDAPGMRGACTGIVAGATALLLLNDSGVVCAALCAVTAWSACVMACGDSAKGLA